MEKWVFVTSIAIFVIIGMYEVFRRHFEKKERKIVERFRKEAFEKTAKAFDGGYTAGEKERRRLQDRITSLELDRKKDLIS